MQELMRTLALTEKEARALFQGGAPTRCETDYGVIIDAPLLVEGLREGAAVTPMDTCAADAYVAVVTARLRAAIFLDPFYNGGDGMRHELVWIAERLGKEGPLLTRFEKQFGGLFRFLFNGAHLGAHDWHCPCAC